MKFMLVAISLLLTIILAYLTIVCVWSRTKTLEVNEPERLSCKFPLLNPFDPSIVEYIKFETSYDCGWVQPYLTFVDYQNYLHFNKSEYYRLLKETNGTLWCEYTTFERSSGPNDDAITFDKPKMLRIGRKHPIRKDFVNVSCTAFDNSSAVVYYNIHAIVSNVSKEIKNESDTQLSVLVFYTDSVSRSAFSRHLPKTLHYLTKVMGGKVFKVSNKKFFTNNADHKRSNKFFTLNWNLHGLQPVH